MGRPPMQEREHLAAHMLCAAMVHFLAHTSRLRWQSVVVTHFLGFLAFSFSLLPWLLSFFSPPALVPGDGDDDGEEDPEPPPSLMVVLVLEMMPADAAPAAARRMTRTKSSSVAEASWQWEQAIRSHGWARRERLYRDLTYILIWEKKKRRHGWSERSGRN